MPARNKTNTMQAEDALARRIAFEREERGWSPAGLASRLTQIGCPMTQSGIWKIENGNPRRRITFDEAVAFAEVFQVPLGELSTDPHAERERLAVVAARRIWEEVHGVEGLGWELRSWIEQLDDYLATWADESDWAKQVVHRELEERLNAELGRVAYDGVTPALGRESARAFLERARYLAKATEAKADG